MDMRVILSPVSGSFTIGGFGSAAILTSRLLILSLSYSLSANLVLLVAKAVNLMHRKSTRARDSLASLLFSCRHEVYI